MLDHLRSFCAALATRDPVRLRIEVNAEAWRTLRAEFHRPYKHEPNAGFTLYLEGGAGVVEFVPEREVAACSCDPLQFQGCSAPGCKGFVAHAEPVTVIQGVQAPAPLTWQPVPPPTEGNS